jgi:hypothetical protein
MGRPPLRNKGAFSAAVPKAKHQVEHVFWLARQVGKPVDAYSQVTTDDSGGPFRRCSKVKILALILDLRRRAIAA